MSAVDNQDGSKPNPEDSAGNPPSPPTGKTRTVEWLQVVVNFVLAVIGIIALCIYGRQLGVFRSQLEQMIVATKAAKESADAAKQAANTAEATLKSSQTSFWIDQRPYVITDGPPQFVTPPNAAGRPIQANVVLKDIGRTPAIKAVWFFDLLPYRAKTRPGYLSFLENSYIALKMRQKATTEKHAAEMSRDIAPTATTFSTENARALSTPEMMDLEKGDGSFILLSVGIVSYTDATRGSYETEFCYFFVGTDPKVWHICDSHNTIR